MSNKSLNSTSKKEQALPVVASLKDGDFQHRVRRLAESHSDARQSSRDSRFVDHHDELDALLNRAYQYFGEASEEVLALSYAAEWLLDNFHVVQQALRQTREDMPIGFYQLLPKLTLPPLEGLPRVYALAGEIIRYCEGFLDLDRITRVVDAYQSFTPLTMREIWALPTMMRLGVLECLSLAVLSIIEMQAEGEEWPSMKVQSSAENISPNWTSPICDEITEIAEEDLVANSIRSLRLMGTTNWKTFFESLSFAERILCQDPSGIYPLMDFETRDRYRKVIENLGQVSDWDELEVAQEAIQMAKDQFTNSVSPTAPERTPLQNPMPPATDPDGSQSGPFSHRNRHVGHFLFDEGRLQLEVRLDYQPKLSLRISRWVLGHPMLVFLTSIALITLTIMISLIGYTQVAGGTILQSIGVGLLALIPSLTIAVDLVNWLITHSIPTRVLPKMDFAKGIPVEYRTMVVVPALLSNQSEIHYLLQQIELHYLGNADPHLHFALLTDFTDASKQHIPEDKTLLKLAQDGIQALNLKYPQGSFGPFYLFHRDRQWNPAEGCWMGWERKRGKLVEFNRLLDGEKDTGYCVQLGELNILPEIRFVITLDADTSLPHESAHRLIATMAHPLNHAEFSPKNGKVTAGYTLLQPRVEIKPTSASYSSFTKIFSGDNKLDLYSRAISDVYQDFFGEGIFVGKGIYNVATFSSSLAGRIPENRLLSHDLFEGILGRAGLVSDVVLFEDYPRNYITFTQRLHRWLRGDWQLLPWLLPRVPHTVRGVSSNPFSILDLWKIIDNLRRSLRSPTILGLLISSWLWLPGSVLFWTVIGILPSIVAGFFQLSEALASGIKRKSINRLMQSTRPIILRWLLDLAFLPYEAWIAMDAISTTLIRLTLTRKNLLQWTSAAHAGRLFEKGVRPRLSWKQSFMALLMVLGLIYFMKFGNSMAIFVATPFLITWLISPQIAYWISLPTTQESVQLSPDQRQQLRSLARRTWHYFQQFIGPGDNWLPPDHFQEDPRGTVAHRTSPTNLGLSLLSTLAAFDLGYLGHLDLILRLRATLEGLDKLEKYRGHFLNWYDTRSLEPLPPRYVSSVDSGNLAACLLTLKQGCLEVPQTPILRWERWQGLLDLMVVMNEILDNLDGSSFEETLPPLRSFLDQIREQILIAQDTPELWPQMWSNFYIHDRPNFNQLLMKLVESGTPNLEPSVLDDIRITADHFHIHIFNAQREVGMLFPWLHLLQEIPVMFEGKWLTTTEQDDSKQPGFDHIVGKWRALHEILQVVPNLGELSKICRKAERYLTELQDLLADIGPLVEVEEALNWCTRLRTELDESRMAVMVLQVGYQDLAVQAEELFSEMDFSFLFDPRRKVFHIGYNMDAGNLDDNYYDLFASEARIASLLAIAKGDVPPSHWLHLARPISQVNGARMLLSWNGSMFEYLMPALLIRSYKNTLIDQSNQEVVNQMIEYGRKKGVPWGISEAGYYQFDANMNYQYRGFGVPGLGYKRGLADDLVISPYASMIALSIDPQAVMHNFTRFIEMDMVGRYGLYEAIDFTPSRLLLGKDRAIVRSYMVHHQGMILLSLVNYLQDNPMIRRFHANRRVQSVERLLQEQVPWQAPSEQAHQENIRTVRPVKPFIRSTPWQVPAESPHPHVHYLSNGRYGVLITSAGGGYSHWQGLDLTRWRSDTTLDNWGSWIYIKDSDSGAMWSAGNQPTLSQADKQEVLFYPHRAVFRRQDHGIILQMDITVPPDDDLEIRRLTLTNRSNRRRKLSITSYGEVVLAPPADDQRHPAFNKLFIESKYHSDINTLIFRRRSRSKDDRPIFLAHSLIVEHDQKITRNYDSDRLRFLGRGFTPRLPSSLSENFPVLSKTTGATLDPIMALSQEIELEPHGSTHVVFLTLAADSELEAVLGVQRYQAWHIIDHAFELARIRSDHELRQLNLTTAELERIQTLLSLLLYPYPGLRSDPFTLASNTQSQPALWVHAISGDYPILLVNISDENETGLIHELLHAHAYWRNREMKIDLVILNHKETGYAQELHGQLLRLINHTNGEGWLNQRGGIFLLRGDLIPETNRVLLFSAARVVLDGDRGSLEEQLTALRPRPALLPYLAITKQRSEDPETTPEVERPPHLLFDNDFGGFSPEGREYMIYLRPGQSTPAPWINVIANPDFGFMVSESGMGNTWSLNSSENRLTPWNNDTVLDSTGEMLYLRDEETAQIWSPTPLPTPASSPYLIRHGMGYSVFEHNSHGLEQQLTLFAAPKDPIKIVKLRLKNLWDRTRRITATFYVEWVLGTRRDITQQYIIPEYDENTRALLARNPYNIDFSERIAFVAASKRPHGLTTDRAEFLGRHGSSHYPSVLDRVGLAGAVVAGNDPCAAIQLHIELAPGESEEVYFLLGQEANFDDAQGLISKYQKEDIVHAAWKETIRFWEDLLGVVTVKTPNQAMDLLLNHWLLYQTVACRIWGRSAHYQSGGAYGFRDQLQDVMALVHAAPQITRDHILRAARNQFELGDVLHWWHPIPGKDGLSSASRGVRTRFSDDLLWLPYATAHYIAASNDDTILKETAPFMKGDPLEPEEVERYGYFENTNETSTLYEHCLRAVNKGSTQGKRGLPLMGSGDWNDGMNRVGVSGHGESVWLGWFLYSTLMRFAQTSMIMGDDQQAAIYREKALELQQSLEANAWDGSWYRRAYYDDGTPLGSSENIECQIDSIAQSWAVLSGAADPQRAMQAMTSVEDRLVRPDDRLILLFTPPFDKTEQDPGYIKGYPPGIRENGGQYTHGVLWSAWAFAELGQGDRAEALFRLLNPIYHADTYQKANLYRVEPYVVAADIYSMPPHTGRGGWTWYTGSAGWMYRLGLEAILGIQREGDWLGIAPSIPKEWPKYEVVYNDGSTSYQILVENPEGVNRGVKKVVLDGEILPDARIPLLKDSQSHVVEVTLG